MTTTAPRYDGPAPLTGRVAVVAGATRGAGRGIAAALGEAGATVVCTGRSSRGPAGRSEYDRPETIEETAELVTGLGGIGVAEVVDHLDPTQVAALAGRLAETYGRIDVLVNDIWGGEVLKGGPPQWNTPIWELDLTDGLRLVHLAVDTHLITSHHLLPLLIAEDGGLLVEVTDGTVDHNATEYRISVFYDLAKASVNRLAFSQGHELAPHGGTAVAVSPGWMRSEIDVGDLRGHRGDVARRCGSRSAGRPLGSARLRPVRDAPLRGPGHRGHGRRPRSGPVEPALGRRR